MPIARPLCFVLLSLMSALVPLAAGCSGGSASGGSTGTQNANDCKDTYPVDQVASEGCCPEWGKDACGAGLFCEAFDGRKQTSCYFERSRTNQAECSADVQCVSGSCNVDARKCRGMQYEPCDPAIGCAPTNTTGSALHCGVEACTT